MMTLYAIAALAAATGAQPESTQRLCAEGEQEVLSATSTQDEFGYSISVCVEEGADEASDRITVILSGEGGNLRTSCIAKECDRVITYQRYTRPRFIELTLKWMTENGEHRLIASHDAPMGADATSSITHFWPGDVAGEAAGEPMASADEPLTLMDLERSLSRQ